MIRSIGFILFIICHFNMKADFEPTALHELIINAEKIVYGKIVDLDSTHFKIKIKGSITGESGILKVKKFENWTCAWRWTEYKKGQNLLLFLNTWNNELVSMGAANEGELPISDNDVHINELSLLYVNGDQNDWSNADFTFKGNHHDIHDGEFYGTKMELSKFIKITKYIRRCFKIEYGSYHQITKWNFNCDIKEIKNKTNKSILLKAILREATERKNER